MDTRSGTEMLVLLCDWLIVLDVVVGYFGKGCTSLISAASWTRTKYSKLNTRHISNNTTNLPESEHISRLHIAKQINATQSPDIIPDSVNHREWTFCQ